MISKLEDMNDNQKAIMSHINKMRDELKYSICLQKLLECKIRAYAIGIYRKDKPDGRSPDSYGTIS